MVLSGIKITCHNSEKIILYGAKKKLIINSAEFYCDNSGCCVFNSFCCLLSFFQIFLMFYLKDHNHLLRCTVYNAFFIPVLVHYFPNFLFSSLYVALGKLIIIVSYQVLSLYFFSGTCFECVV